MSREAGFPVACSWLLLASPAPGLAFAPVFAGLLLLVVGFRYDKLARSFLDALHSAAIRRCLGYATL